MARDLGRTGDTALGPAARECLFAALHRVTDRRLGRRGFIEPA